MKTLPTLLLFISISINIFGQNTKIIDSSTGTVISNSGGSDSPTTSSILDVRSSNKGVLLPRMTTTNRNAIVSPQAGLLIYNSTSSQFNYHDGSNWQQLFLGNQWNTNGTSFYYSGGNVGIGESNPTQKLVVNGTVASTTGFKVNGNSVANYYYSSPWMTCQNLSADTTIDATCYRRRTLSIPELTTDVLNTGMVTVYFRIGSVGPLQLPYISDAGGYTNQINFIMKKAGEIIIFRHTFNTCRFNSGIPEAYPGQPVMVNLPQALEYRVVIIND